MLCKERLIVCFETPVLRTGSQKETLALSCLLCCVLLNPCALHRGAKEKPPPLGVVVCCTAFGRKTRPPVSRVVVYRQVPRKPRLACPVKCEAYLIRVSGDESAQFINNQL